MNNQECYRFYVPTVLGNIGIVWCYHENIPLVIRIYLPEGDGLYQDSLMKEFGGAEERTCPVIDSLAGSIRKFSQGNPVKFDPGVLDWKICTSFQKRVLEAECRIPYGWVSTYGGLAEEIGSPRGARAVGGALANNPFPLVIPCHRTIRSDGDLGGFGGGRKLKRALLELEGVKLDLQGRVIMDRIYYPD